MKKILITGGDGYVGSKLAKALKEAKHKVEIFDRPKDILNKAEMEKSITGKDSVFHLAALAEINYTDKHPQETFDTNVVGTNIIAEICSRKKVLLNFASTCCIYGDPLEFPSVEDWLINPTDAYAMSKAACEWVVKMWGLSKGLKYNIMRFGTVYGPGTRKEQRSDMCIQKFLNAAKDKLPITITGNGHQARNFIHIEDLVRGMVMLNESIFFNETLNFAGSERITINRIAELAQQLGAGPSTYVPDRKDDFKEQGVSCKKAFDLLGWSPRVPFEDGFIANFNWLCQQP